LVTGLFGVCANTASDVLNAASLLDHDKQACQHNWHDPVREPNCKANLGSPCILKSDCTGNPANLICRAPVDTGSTYSIMKVGQGSDNCDPLCNGVASFTATVDFSLSTDATSTYSIQKGCYDERFASGMRRLGSSGSGAGMQNVHLDWKTLIPNGELVTSPLVDSNGDVIVASLRGALTKLSSSGQKYWSIYVGSVVGNPAMGSDGTIYFGSGDRNVWAVTSNGITRWRYTTPMPVHASPLVTDTGVFIGDRNGTFYRFNLDGSVAWKYHANGEIWGGSAMTRDGRIVFGSLDTYLYCLNATTGTLIFKATTGQEIAGTPLIQDVSIVFGTRENDDEYGQVVCLKMDGTVRWTYSVTSSIESQPAEGPNGEVYVATVDGKIFAIQADGQLMWKYNTGGTGGVCKAATVVVGNKNYASYATARLSVGTGDNDATDGSSIVLKDTTTNAAPRYYPSGAVPSSADGHYTGYRATFRIGTGVLRVGQFSAIDFVDVIYAPTYATHDTVFTDASEQDTAIVLKFKTSDRMVPGEIVELVLPGLVTAGNNAAKDVYPLSTTTPSGQIAFAGASGTLDCAAGCSVTSVKLQNNAAGQCGADDVCLGSTISFVSGTGAGQTATIVDYVHGTRVATITYVNTVPDATTTYTVSPAIIPKFTARYTFATPTATLKLEVPFADGTFDCAAGNGCSHTQVRLATAAAGIISNTANMLNGYFIQIYEGTGAGQTSTCVKYYGSATNFRCDVDFLAVIPDATSKFRIGPRVEPGEDTTIVIPAAGSIKYPSFSGKTTGGSATSLVIDAQSSPSNDFYTGMAVTIRRGTPGSLAAGVTTTQQTVWTLTETATAFKIGVGSFIKVGSELVKVLAIDADNANNKQITVERGMHGTTRAIHANSAVILAFEFTSVTGYIGATQTATVPTLPFAVAANDLYRFTGGGSGFTQGQLADRTDFSVSPKPYFGYNLVPTTYSNKAGKVKLADESVTRANSNYVGAVLVITDGPGAGLKGTISAYDKTSGEANVLWNLDYCGDPAYCTPVGDTEAGTCQDTTACAKWIRKASHYEIQVIGAVSNYVGSTRTLALTQLPGSGNFSVPATSSYCSAFDDATLMNRCATYASVDTPVFLEWSSGAWCGSGGGTGWGATSPCVSNGLVVTTSANKFVYGLGLDGVVKFKYMTGKRIKSPPRYVIFCKAVFCVLFSSSCFSVKTLAEPAQLFPGCRRMPAFALQLVACWTS
jgi:outer membrane protein assembly factor BamB